MKRLATGLLILACAGGTAALIGSCVEVARFGWQPPVILAGVCVAYLGYAMGNELGERAYQTPSPLPEEEPPDKFPDPYG